MSDTYTYEPLILKRSSWNAPLEVASKKKFGKASSIDIVLNSFKDAVKKRNQTFVPVERRRGDSQIPKGIVMRTNKPWSLGPNGEATFIGIRRWKCK